MTLPDLKNFQKLMKTLNKTFLTVVILLNCIHLFLPFGYNLNSNFNPALSILALSICLYCFKMFSNLKRDRFFVMALVFSVITQNISNKVNGGVPDYINFYLFTSNIPDMLIFGTILTWWYYRVYKHQNINPAKVPAGFNAKKNNIL